MALGAILLRFLILKKVFICWLGDFCVVALGPEPIALCVLGMPSITELHPKLRNVCSTTMAQNTD